MDARIKSGHDKRGRGKGINSFATFCAHSAPIDGWGGEKRGRMCTARLVLAILAAGLGVSACQSPKATFERTFLPDPAKPYVGMTKEQIVACAGTPAGRYNTDTGETLVYHYSGAGPVPQAAPKKDESKQTNPFGKKNSDKDYDCNASLVFEGGRLTRVTFAPRLAVSPYETKTDPKTHEKVPVEQPKPCSFSLPNCRGG